MSAELINEHHEYSFRVQGEANLDHCHSPNTPFVPDTVTIKFDGDGLDEVVVSGALIGWSGKPTKKLGFVSFDQLTLSDAEDNYTPAPDWIKALVKSVEVPA